MLCLAIVMSRIRIANAPCSWGVVKGVDGQESLSWLQVLDDMQTAGYAGTELGDWGFMPNDAALIERELASREAWRWSVRSRRCACGTPTATLTAEATALRTARLLAEVTRGTPEEGQPFVILADDPGPGSHRVQNAGRITDGGRPERRAVACAGGGRRASGAGGARRDRAANGVPPPLRHVRRDAGGDGAAAGLDACRSAGAVSRHRPLRVWRRRPARPAAPLPRPRLARALQGLRCGQRLRRRRPRRGTTSRRFGTASSAEWARVPSTTRPSSTSSASSGYDGWIVVENEAPPGRVPPLLMAQNDRAYLAGLGRMTPLRVGVIGVGAMGSIHAEHLADAHSGRPAGGDCGHRRARRQIGGRAARRRQGLRRRRRNSSPIPTSTRSSSRHCGRCTRR